MAEEPGSYRNLTYVLYHLFHIERFNLIISEVLYYILLQSHTLPLNKNFKKIFQSKHNLTELSERSFSATKIINDVHNKLSLNCDNTFFIPLRVSTQ